MSELTPEYLFGYVKKTMSLMSEDDQRKVIQLIIGDIIIREVLKQTENPDSAL